MSITKTRTFTRPNTNVQWFNNTQETKDYIQRTYVDTGKRVARHVKLTNNDLTMVITTVWRDQAALDEWQSDKTIGNSWKEHNKVNNIFTEVI